MTRKQYSPKFKAKVAVEAIRGERSAFSAEQARLLVEPDHPEISVRRQCDLLGVNRSGLSYQSTGERAENL